MNWTSETYEGALPRPLAGMLEAFLHRQGLRYAPGDFTVLLRGQEGEIAACGLLAGRVLQCIAVDPSLRGEGLTAAVMTALRARAFTAGIERLFLFTKPHNGYLFTDFGFTPISQTDDMLLMESERGGISRFIASLDKGPEGGTHGCVVANCNPFTLGHRYLIEQASAACDVLHLFILSEDKSDVPADVRFFLVQQGVADYRNVIIHPTSDYLISSVTFPTYFLKDESLAAQSAGKLDLTIFCDHFAPALHITRRFVGQEPFCAVTASYNVSMKEILPPRGIEVIEIPRLEIEGTAVSASRVRQLWRQGNWGELRPLVPECTWKYLSTGLWKNGNATK